MNPGLLGLAVVVVAGGVVAVAARESRAAVVGVALALVLSPLIATPVPEPLSLAARLVAAILAAYLLWVPLRADVPTRGSAIGWPADLLVGAAAGVAGAAAAGIAEVGAPAAVGVGVGVGIGPREALIAGFGLGALAIGPLLAGRDALRLGIGLLLATQAAILVRVAMLGTASPFEQLAIAGLFVTLGTAAAALGAAAIRLTDSLELVAIGSAVRAGGPAPPGAPIPPRSAGAHRIPDR